MPLTRQQKEQRVQALQQHLSGAASIVFVAFTGLTVQEMSELRNKLAEANGSLRVMPKRLLKIALKNLALDFNPLAPEGQLAVAWGSDDTSPAKMLSSFAKTHQGKVRLLAGTLAGNMLAFAEVSALAALPTREVLLGQLASVLAGPSRGLVSLLAAVPRSLVYALNAIKEQREAASGSSSSSLVANH